MFIPKLTKFFLVASLVTQCIYAKDPIIFAFCFSPTKKDVSNEAWLQIAQKIENYRSNNDLESIQNGIDMAQELFVKSIGNTDIRKTILINVTPEQCAQTDNLDVFGSLRFVISPELDDINLWQNLENETETLVKYCQNTDWKNFDYTYYFESVKNIFKKAFSGK